MFLKKLLPAIFLTLIFYIFPSGSFAVTCCVDHGGEYACDYSTGKLYCRDGTLSTDCTCRRVTLTPSPTTKPTPVPTLPSCVPNSTYDRSLKACKCNNGYLVEGNTCISYRDFCWHNYGSNSTYDSVKEGCVCSSGYLWDSEGNSCITYNKTCQNKLGVNSYYNSKDNTCNCFEGYYIKNNKCELVPTPETSTVLETKVAVETTPEPSITKKPKLNITTVRSATNEPELIVKDGGEASYVTESKSEKNIISRVFENIWNFIKSIF